MPSHLSATEQKQVQTVIDRARGDRTVPHSAQESIPFQRMFPDGICRVTDNYYTKTIRFQDINYQLAQQEDQTAIFEEWCSFLNFFDSSIRFELSFMNMAGAYPVPEGSFQSGAHGVQHHAAPPACPGQQRSDQDEVPDVWH